MYTVKFTTAYKKNYKLMKKRGLDLTLLDDVVEELRQGKSLDKKYKDHILKGEYAGFHECHIKPEKRCQKNGSYHPDRNNIVVPVNGGKLRLHAQNRSL